ncbi:MAG: CbiX/SirB N-terminal domain-containing protein [Euryarchaeota archaeon]|nr:CbiX/SirB N-terminal domain-containing protein [Euryarchaeota archaeon]
MITCVGIAGAGISSANWHADAGESITGIDSDNNQTKIGVLIIAHGSSSESWCAPVRATVANVSLPYPVELGFLEKVPGESIEDAVDKLNSHGVSEIIAVPLFVSSSSNHISEIEYILGLGDMIPGEDDLVQVNTTANITLTGAMDDHWIISSILADNAADFGEDPSNKTAVLVAHGVSDDETIFAGWNESSASLAEQTLLRLRHIHNLDIKSVCYSFINLNETLHPDRAVRAVVEEISSDSTPVVLSRILSPGYHTKRKIPALLENLTYLYDNETALATHPALSEWIDISVYEAVSDLSFSAYHGENGEIVELTIEEAVAGHEGGKLCPCVAVAWRASQFALSEVWSDVDQSDLKITSAHPSDGHEETFLYILNNSTADYTIEMPEGTDPKNLTTANYIYTFTSKSTGDSVTVRVKDDAFPDKLFDLRMKCKAGTATPDEKKAFKLIKNELKDGFLYLPMDELFDAEVVSDLSFSVYDGKNGEIIELTIEGAAAMHDGGKLCPSVAASWRASQFALSDIWGCVPRSDLGITSAHPSDGHEATFLYILNNSTEDYVVKMPEGTDTTNLSTENYVYTFVRKSTGDSVTVRVKDGIIPDEFLELRKKLRAKTATPDEIKVFKLIKDELKARLMYLPASELFDSEVTYSKFDTGILVVAHGSPREMWCAPVRAAVHNVDLPYPVELGFLEFVPGETINAAVDRLDKHGAREIIAIPLFVSSHSDHIAEVEYVLGLRDSLPGAHHASEMSVMSNNAGRAGMTTFASEKEAMRSVVKKGDKYFISRVTVAGHPGGAEEEELVPVETDAAITLTGAIDDHWLVGEILADRARALSTNPANETAVLVAHGADNETDIAEWIDDSKSLAEQVDLRLRFISDKEPALDLAGVRYSFLFHNETLHPNIKTREVVEDVSTTSDALVVPFMVSSGFFTGTLIPQMELANLTYAYDGDALLPHPKIADLIEIKASEEFTDLAFPVYDSESGETVNLTIEGAAAGHDDGELCLCVAVSFRVSQFALSEVWSDVDQSDLKITSAYPSDGHEETFLYILNNSTADYTVDMPEGTDPKNLTKANYVYTFTRKSTEESVTVRVKDGIFLDELFELRKKCKAGTATPDEKKAFKLIKRELKDRFMYLPIDGLFEIKSPSLKGDVNGDGMVTTADAAIVLEMATSGEWKEVADVNGDGRVTSFDALMIVQAAAGKIEV